MARLDIYMECWLCDSFRFQQYDLNALGSLYKGHIQELQINYAKGFKHFGEKS